MRDDTAVAGQREESYYLPIFADHMRKMAPKEADTKSWR
jgi:hypothetical protein